MKKNGGRKSRETVSLTKKVLKMGLKILTETTDSDLDDQYWH
jgi:hypothetical protein